MGCISLNDVFNGIYIPFLMGNPNNKMTVSAVGIQGNDHNRKLNNVTNIFGHVKHCHEFGALREGYNVYKFAHVACKTSTLRLD